MKNNYQCYQCKNLFYKKPSQKAKSDKHFCSRTCLNEYFTKQYKNTHVSLKCSSCGKNILRRKTKIASNKTDHVFCSKKCKDIFKFENKGKGKSRIGHKSLSECLRGTDANKYASIRDNARRITSLRLQLCSNCNYDKHVETCHIKDISDFSSTALLSEINAKTNLILLCRNCHWEFDDWKKKIKKGIDLPCPIKFSK